MEIQVQELIDKIKREGVDTASQEAARIKMDAQTEARQILEAAKKEADSLISNAKDESRRTEKAATAALHQASRNLILAFKEEVQSLLNKIVNESVSANYGEDVLKNALPEILKAWAQKDSDNMSVLLPENELSRLHGFFNEKLKNELGRGVELKSNRKLSYGFHISNKEGSVYYDFSAEAVAGLLSAYLNPKLANILKESTEGM